MNWLMISLDKGLSAAFLLEHQDKLNWGWISLHHDLSETMIESFADKVDWRLIAACQNISLSFIEKHRDKLLLSQLKENKHLTTHKKELDILFKDQKEMLDDIENVLDGLL